MTDAISASAAPLTVEIPGSSSTASARDYFISRSAKGEQRSDAAAPPTVAANGEGTFSFADLMDTINPLQHIPGVNLAYRAITGDKIAAPANVAGGILYGGALGGLASLAMSLFSELTDASAAPLVATAADVNRSATPDIAKAG